MTSQTKVAGVILAGGRARRMNFQNKGLMPYQGRPLIDYSFTALLPLVDEMLINANSDSADYQQWGVRVIADNGTDFLGPLAGVLAAMNATYAEHLIVIPCDAPFIRTPHLAKLLHAHHAHAPDITVACCGAQVHSVFMVVKTDLKASLQASLSQGERKVRHWFAQHCTHYVDFGEKENGFENINTLEALQATPSPSHQNPVGE